MGSTRVEVDEADLEAQKGTRAEGRSQLGLGDQR
jgi:hypothetical protein